MKRIGEDMTTDLGKIWDVFIHAGIVFKYDGTLTCIAHREDDFEDDCEVIFK